MPILSYNQCFVECRNEFLLHLHDEAVAVSSYRSSFISGAEFDQIRKLPETAAKRKLLWELYILKAKDRSTFYKIITILCECGNRELANSLLKKLLKNIKITDLSNDIKTDLIQNLCGEQAGKLVNGNHRANVYLAIDFCIESGIIQVEGGIFCRTLNSSEMEHALTKILRTDGGWETLQRYFEMQKMHDLTTVTLMELLFASTMCPVSNITQSDWKMLLTNPQICTYIVENVDVSSSIIPLLTAARILRPQFDDIAGNPAQKALKLLDILSCVNPRPKEVIKAFAVASAEAARLLIEKAKEMGYIYQNE